MTMPKMTNGAVSIAPLCAENMGLGQELIRTKQQEADAIVFNNPGVMEEYQDRCAKIADLEEEARTIQERISLHLGIIAERKVRAVLSQPAGDSSW